MSTTLPLIKTNVDVPVCPLDDIPAGLGRAYDVGGASLAIFRTRSGSLHALENACPHRGAPLADGMLAGGRVVCPYHAQRFDLKTGQCDREAAECVLSYETHVEGGWVVVSVPADVLQTEEVAA